MAHAIPPDSPPPSAATTSPAPEPALPLRGSLLPKYTARLVVSLLLGAGLAWLLVRGGLPLVPPAAAFSQLRLWTVPAYVASLALVHYFRAARWRFLLRPIGHVPMRSVLGVSWIAFAIILLSPLRTGEVVRPYLVSRRGPVKLWEAAGTVGAERIIDGLTLSVILFLSLRLASPLDPLPDHIGDLPVPAAAVPGAAYTVLALFSVAFAMMALFFLARDFARRITLAVIGVISASLAARLAAIVERVAEGLRFLPSARHLAPFLLETMAYWGINAAGVWLLAWGAGLAGMTFVEACVTMGCIGIGILVPSGPGFFGAFQLSTYMALAMYFSEDLLRGPGAAFVFLLYVTQVGWHLVAAGIGVALDRSPEAEPAR